jgi:hypothetical protein
LVMVAPLLIQVEVAEVAGLHSKAKVEGEVGQCLMAMAAEVAGLHSKAKVEEGVGQSLKGVVEVEGVDYLSKGEVV